MKLEGPYPADTLFQPKYLKNAAAFLTMYHDQGLPVLKYAAFDHGYNTTLGLPYIRTSVDHEQLWILPEPVRQIRARFMLP